MSQSNGKAKRPKLGTLRDVVERYIASGPDLRSDSIRKLRYLVNCWERRASITLPITTADVEQFRRSALEAKLSPYTIETTINDMLCCLRAAKCKVPDRGRRLKKPRPMAKQPSLEDIAKVYAMARSAQFPRRTVNGERGHNGATSKEPVWRDWSDDDRLRFWRTLLVLTVRGGIRLGHFRDLKWEHVASDRLEWQAGKSQCRIKVTPEIKQHLDSVRHLDPIYVVPIAKWSVRYVRRELNKLRKKAGLPTWRNVLPKDLEKVYPLAGLPKYPAKTLAADRDRSCWRFWSDDDRERFWRALLFLGMWTGLRIDDLRRLTWASVFSDRIEWRASKTGTPHVFPMTPDVQRHLDLVRGLDSVIVLPVAKGSVRFVRRELKRLCKLAGVEPFVPKMVRRASITEWGCTIQDAGALIHGCGLGVREHYVNPLKILTRAAGRFELPAAMRDPAKPPTTPESSNGHAVADVLAKLSPDVLATLVKLATALVAEK